MSKYLFGIFLSLFCCSNVSKHCQVANNLINSFAYEVSQSDGLKVRAYGGKLMGDIKQIDFDFVTVQELDIASARKLYINTMQKLINRMNTDNTVKPFLHNFPANENNVEIAIAFYQPQGKYVNEKYVAFVFMANNKIYYRSWNGKFQPMHEETYTEALRIVRGG